MECERLRRRLAASKGIHQVMKEDVLEKARVTLKAIVSLAENEESKPRGLGRKRIIANLAKQSIQEIEDFQGPQPTDHSDAR